VLGAATERGSGFQIAFTALEVIWQKRKRSAVRSAAQPSVLRETKKINRKKDKSKLETPLRTTQRIGERSDGCSRKSALCAAADAFGKIRSVGSWQTPEAAVAELPGREPTALARAASCGANPVSPRKTTRKRGKKKRKEVSGNFRRNRQV